jgi:hypothetical protein
MSTASYDHRQLEAEIRAIIEKRLVTTEQPPRDFDALIASRADLEGFGIAPMPSEPGNPGLLALWQEALARPIVLKTLTLKDIKLDFSYRLAKPDEINEDALGRRGLGTSRQSSSRNWSGASVVANKFRRFTAIASLWRVPLPNPPPGAPVDGDYRATTWIGLDGDRLRSRSLPQLGTTQAVVVASGVAQPPTYSAWFQWWVRDAIYPPMTFDPTIYPVDAGDTIISYLWVNAGSNSVNVIMANVSQLWAVIFKFLGNGASLPVEGSTAEWIVERPTDLNNPDVLYPLPDYGQVLFLACNTAAAHDPPGGVAGDLDDARRIRMRLDVTGPPHRSAIISLAQKFGSHSVLTRYRAP